ncbi:hypothetical protein EDB89DRAFT_165878 [Lactarius sanguifluus]|nr:hypothetical protein EDB89DRAFT_165878 [Lactarius sanguifluus]
MCITFSTHTRCQRIHFSRCTTLAAYFAGVRRVLSERPEQFSEEITRFEQAYDGKLGVLAESRKDWNGVTLVRERGRLLREREKQKQDAQKTAVELEFGKTNPNGLSAFPQGNNRSGEDEDSRRVVLPFQAQRCGRHDPTLSPSSRCMGDGNGTHWQLSGERGSPDGRDRCVEEGCIQPGGGRCLRSQA